MSEAAILRERLQKILARAGVASRRKVEQMILEGRVTLNGRVATLGDKADVARDAIKVDGKRVGAPVTHHYLLLNKPKGVMTTVEDPEGRPTVMELVPAKFRKALVPVGRLDFMTEGLLLLTSDGEFAQRLSHPRYGCRKTYLAKVSGTPRDVDLDKLRAGVVLDGRRTAPCRIEATHPPSGKREGENTWWNVDLSEGRTRQIREMFERIGHPVQKLRRVAIGPLRDAALPVGALRELSAEEVERLLRATASVKPRRTAPPVASVRGQGGERPAARPRVPAPEPPPKPRPFGARSSDQGQRGKREGRPERAPSRFAPRPRAAAWKRGPQDVERLRRVMETAKPGGAASPPAAAAGRSGVRHPVKAGPRAQETPRAPRSFGRRSFDRPAQEEREKRPPKRQSRFVARPPSSPAERGRESQRFTAKPGAAPKERPLEGRPVRRRADDGGARGSSRPPARPWAGAARGPARAKEPGAGKEPAGGRGGFARRSGTEVRRDHSGPRSPKGPGRTGGPRGPRERPGRGGPAPAGGPRNRGGRKPR
jgi:23S rRNA pseudouridine2605 synthase